MNFRTEIDIAIPAYNITHKDSILMMGSCFIENIGNYLVKNKFNSIVNPFGILYNPQSILQALNMICEDKRFTETDLLYSRNLYHSSYHHSRFSNTDKNACLDNINKSITKAHLLLKSTNILFITFGTSYVYFSKTQQHVVGNCHKLPASEFDRYRIETDDIVEMWTNLIERLKDINPTIKIIFTVSPIRHMKDGAHENQLSKATLLLAVNKICKQQPNTSYFPSYEIMLDELRDYRFYNEDMIHPSPVAIKYIWEKFSQIYFREDTQQIISEWSKIEAAINHRPLNDKDRDYKHFLEQTLLKINTFADKYKYICCDKEIASIEARISDIK